MCRIRREFGRVMVLTDRRQAMRSLPEMVADAPMVVLREKDLPRAERAALAAELQAVLASAGGLLIVASDPTIPADGVHLATADPWVEAPIVGRSCHSLRDVERAAAEGCDYVTVSPVFVSRSKPGYGPSLGLDGLAAICRHASIPVYALGGVDPSNAPDCLDAGAYGVAMMGAAMRGAAVL